MSKFFKMLEDHPVIAFCFLLTVIVLLSCLIALIQNALGIIETAVPHH